jgi:predicted TPR repeat methyltransferase
MVDDRFERARLLFVDGLAAYQAGRWAEAEERFGASLELLPGRVSTLINLAAARLRQGHAEAALEAANDVLAQEPANADAHWHAADAYDRLGRAAEARTAYRRVLEADPRHADARFRLAQLDERGGDAAAALAGYEQALQAAPAHADAWAGYGGLLRQIGRLSDAAAAFRMAREHGADAALVDYYLDAVDGASRAAAAPRAYVQALFDGYAGEYDRHMVQGLGYRGHRTLVDALPETCSSALDLGCGTGLCGPLLRPRAQRLTGVDVSARMLERAAALGVYDALVQAELLQHLQVTNERHDIVLAADVFIYIGDLAPVFAAVRRVLAEGGTFAFSVEHAERAPAGWTLLPSLRYAHAEPYLRHLAASHGFTVRHLIAQPLRSDQGRAIEGLYAWLEPA